MKIFRRLISYVTPYWSKLIVIVICTAIVNGLVLAQPLLFRDLLNKVLLQYNLGALSIVTVDNDPACPN